MNTVNHNRFDQVLGPQRHTLPMRNLRAEILANNIANTETPGFLARDLDFKSMLAEADGKTKLLTSHKSHIGQTLNAAKSISTNLDYRIPTQPSADGNTVESAVEKAEFAKNTINYVADLSFINSRVQGLLRAIRGD